MKYILITLVIFQLALSTAKAETWSCAHRMVNNEFGVLAYTRVGDHFETTKYEWKWEILFESYRVLVLSHLYINEDVEVAQVYGIVIDKVEMEGKRSGMHLWFDNPDANHIEKMKCTVSD